MSSQSELAERHRIEQRFHDERAREVESTFYDFGALDAPDAYLWSQLGDLRGKSVLEIGCGTGTTTLAFAAAGATVTALDISSEMVDVMRDRVTRAGFADRVTGLHSSVEHLTVEPASFDLVYGHSVLHHLDLSAAAPRISAALRPSGRAAFLDPLDHNPVLNLMRRLTPEIRTPTEKPLDRGDIARLGAHFSTCVRREFHLTALAAFVFWYGMRDERLFRASLASLARIDDALFKFLPFTRELSWVTVLTLVK